MSDLLIIARAMGAPKERGGLAPSSHKFERKVEFLEKMCTRIQLAGMNS